MAEFREVMKQWRRFCKSHSNCGECEFDGKGICGEAHLSDVPYSDMEMRIMAWAAEHPVVYPTWGEWLESIGVAEVGSGMLSIHPAIAEQPIPASFAREHGIEPKEG